jgi:hypothetical protein
MDEPEQLAAALARAQEAAKELNALDDQLSRMIPEYEEALKNLRLGVALSVPLDVTGPDYRRYLSFEKYGGSWRLLIQEGPDDDPESWTQTPLASASRDERAAVFAWHLDKFIASVEHQIHAMIIKLAAERLATIKSLGGGK